jgi:hypothetical protein
MQTTLFLFLNIKGMVKLNMPQKKQ